MTERRMISVDYSSSTAGDFPVDDRVWANSYLCCRAESLLWGQQDGL